MVISGDVHTSIFYPFFFSIPPTLPIFLWNCSIQTYGGGGRDFDRIVSVSVMFSLIAMLFVILSFLLCHVVFKIKIKFVTDLFLTHGYYEPGTDCRCSFPLPPCSNLWRNFSTCLFFRRGQPRRGLLRRDHCGRWLGRRYRGQNSVLDQKWAAAWARETAVSTTTPDDAATRAKTKRCGRMSRRHGVAGMPSKYQAILQRKIDSR